MAWVCLVYMGAGVHGCGWSWECVHGCTCRFGVHVGGSVYFCLCVCVCGVVVVWSVWCLAVSVVCVHVGVCMRNDKHIYVWVCVSVRE